MNVDYLSRVGCLQSINQPGKKRKEYPHLLPPTINQDLEHSGQKKKKGFGITASLKRFYIYKFEWRRV